MIEFALLGSGSGGNAFFVRTAHAAVLIDNGLSLKRLTSSLETLGCTPEHLDAVLVTHEHSDHVNGLGVLARRYNLPVYITQDTFHALPEGVGDLPCVKFFTAGDTLQIKDLTAVSFQVCHDACDPVAFSLHAYGLKVGVATDMGHVTHLVRQKLSGSHALVLESNYCPEMLQNGPYSVTLRQRIQGKMGHLSNYQVASLLRDLLHEQLRLVVLAHLSENNNSPERVQRAVQPVLNGHTARLHIVKHGASTPPFRLQP
jgi:phosphoribosyl 1,2-cyclic phosphodiesterase